MRFVRGRYYCITRLIGNTYHCLVEFRSRNGAEYYTYSLASSDDAYVNPDRADHYLKFNVKKVRDPARCSIKEVSTIDLLLYFGDYVGRRYKDILAGINPNRAYSKSVQGKAIARKRKSSFTRKSF